MSCCKGWYEEFWRDQPDRQRAWQYERRSELLRALVQPGDEVLDLGCGAGHFLELLGSLAATVVGVDIAPSAVALARRKVAGCDVRESGQDGSIPLGTATVDFVWCSEVLEHIVDTGAVLTEIRRVLRPGGRLLVTVPAHSLLKRLFVATLAFEKHFDPLGQHLRFYTRRSLATVLDLYGFSDLKQARLGGTLAVRGCHVVQVKRD